MRRRAVGRAVAWLDQALGRLTGRRAVVFEVRTPMNMAVLRPVYDAVAADPRLSCAVTSDDPGARLWLPASGVRAPFVSRSRAAWRRLDLYVNADPWGAAPLHRCRRQVNFSHGVAGKYDLDAPHRLPIAFTRYDRVAFINADRLKRYVDAGVIPPSRAALVGYPKVDSLARGEIDGARVRAGLGLSPARPTALYAPTFSAAASLHLAGPAIVRTLLDAGWNVVVKLHDRSMVPSPKYTAGIDWPAVFRGFAPSDRFAFSEAGDATPLLAAADAMVTDHSTIGFEFLLLDRPLIVFDAPDLLHAARVNPEKASLLRSAGQVVTDLEGLAAAAAQALRTPHAQSDARRRVAAEVFYDAGRATERARRLVYELLELEPVRDAAGAVAPAAAA